LFATVAPEKLASRELDASVGASGPHDFAVRLKRHSSRAHPRPPHPAPTFVTIASRPSAGQDGASFKSDLGELRSKIFLQKGLDAGSTNDSDLPVEAGQELGIFES
jgi:hypothetical protein